MWMVKCNDHENVNKEMTIASARLRSLMPRPNSNCSNKSSTIFSPIPSPCCCCIHNPNILSWNHPLGSDYGSSRREMKMTNMPIVSSRWNPTTEQLQALEEMYRRGTRTPSAEQIQQIASKLRRFGKIEGKNVFYWFQNHKARERQKKRRQLELQTGKKLRDVETAEKKHAGLNKRYLQIEPTKKLPTDPSNCTTPSQDSADCKKDGWTELNQKEFQHQIIKNETFCWKLDLSSSNTAIASDNYYSGQENANRFGALSLITRLLPPKNSILENGVRENQTLQLFPVRSYDNLMSNLNGATEEENQDVSTKFKPNEFIEFLPTKN